MNLFYVLPFLVGIAGVLQGGLNKRLAPEWGLAWVLMFTSIVVLFLSGALILTNAYPGKFDFSALKWWHAVPGVLGFAVIFFIPLSIERVGALTTFLIIMASQILASGLWDRFVEGASISWTRGLGTLIAILGAWLATR